MPPNEVRTIDWTSYRPEDFLMFAPRTYWRLVELHHEAWWPLHLLTLAAGAAAGAGLALRRPLAVRVGTLVVALACGWVAAAFVAERLVPIFWPAQALTALLAVAALGLALGSLGLVARPTGWQRLASLGLLAFALILYPGLGQLSGRPASQAEVFGLSPDPTVLAVLAWVGATCAAGPVGRWGRRLAGGAAAAAALFSAGTLALMGSWQALVPLAAVVVFGCMVRR